MNERLIGELEHDTCSNKMREIKSKSRFMRIKFDKMRKVDLSVQMEKQIWKENECEAKEEKCDSLHE